MRASSCEPCLNSGLERCSSTDGRYQIVGRGPRGLDVRRHGGQPKPVDRYEVERDGETILESCASMADAKRFAEADAARRVAQTARSNEGLTEPPAQAAEPERSNAGLTIRLPHLAMAPVQTAQWIAKQLGPEKARAFRDALDQALAKFTGTED